MAQPVNPYLDANFIRSNSRYLMINVLLWTTQPVNHYLDLKFVDLTLVIK